MSKRYKILLTLFLTVFASLIVFNIALAQVDVGVGYGENIGLSNKDPRDIVVDIIQVALGFLGIVAVIIILYAGFRWMTSGGDPAKIDKAKKTLIAGIIGLLIILASWGITAWLIRDLGGAIIDTSCTPGDTRPCNSCEGAGMQTCSASQTWGPCSTACGGTVCCNNVCCAIGEQCCPFGCFAGPCGPGPVTCDDNGNTGDGCGLPANCDPATEYCDAADCLCKDLGTFGDPCDQDTSLPTCDIPDDSLCAAWLHCDIDDCTCAGGPVIQWFSPDDGSGNPVGTEGNFMTIGGSYFGSTPGQVLFWDGSDFTIAAEFPNTVNPACINTWTDFQVIIVVPAGVNNAPIRLVRADKEHDDSDDARGPAFSDFVDDGIIRPGTCLVDPASGFFDDPFDMHGINYGDITNTRTIRFGNQTSSFAANNINFIDDQNANATVPNLKAAKTTVFVEVDEVSSNYLSFQVLYDWVNAPFISYIDPATGTPEQYITIYGGNFKSYLGGTSLVTMTSQTSSNSYNADGLDFPPECQDSWWKDKQIVVKVPPGTDGDFGFYNVTVTNRSGATSPAEIFEVIDGVPGPGLCKLDPANGLVNQAVILIGDNFSPSPGFVRFFNNATISIFSPGVWTNQYIDTNVPLGAQTGPVRVSNGSRLSNSLQFTVGLCTNDSECDGLTCCPSGTYWAGICRPAGDCGPAGPAGAEFAWTFTTTGGGPVVGDPCHDPFTAPLCAIPTPPVDCTISGLICDPNSCTCQQPCYDPANPGSCDPSWGSCPPDKICDPNSCICVDETGNSCIEHSVITGNCDPIMCPNSAGQCSPYDGSQPEDVGDCADADCDGVGACGAGCIYESALNKCTNSAICDPPYQQDVYGNLVTAYCDWYGEPPAERWHLRTNTSCPPGWIKWINDICINPIDSCLPCADGFDCFDAGGSGLCAVDQNICPSGSDCIGEKCIKDGQEDCECCCRIGMASEDCCVPLDCIGDCGTDRVSDTGAFGYCSGCRIESSPGVVDYAASDAACNCLNASGKFCDVDVDVDGDGTFDGICRDCSQIGVFKSLCDMHATVCCSDYKASSACKGGDAIPSGADFGYCDYYDCLPPPNEDQCDIATPLPDAAYKDQPTCVGKCAAGSGGAEQPCQSPNFPACTTGGLCSNPYDCIDEAAADCRCCCDPANDLCPAPLSCYTDQGLCTGPTRGLCCGCTSDSECSGGVDGCGNDTCCHLRPSVDSVIPADNDTDICLNPLLKAEFNEPMDIGSFAGNLILIGDYKTDPCPNGTQFLVRMDPNQPRGMARIFNSIFTFFKRLIAGNARLAKAQFGNNFCAIPGTTSGYNGPDGVLIFTPSRLLDPQTDYYAIIKGDANLTDALAQGVRNTYEVGMNGPNSQTFNTVTFNNAYIWSFTTGEEVCKLSSVEIEPESYLFNTAANDPSDDDPASPAFDTVFDRDKAFFAYAHSSGGQLIAPIPGIYDWSWGWSSDNSSIAQVAVLPAVTTSTAMVTAQEQKDARTFIRATAQITADIVNNPTTVGQARSGRAAVYVFMCGNPWPPRAANGNWSPWMDAADNCTITAGGCGLDNNFEIYYCRDAGGAGTADDLPSIASSTVIRGSSAATNILKEFYFLRDEIPYVETNTILVVNQGDGVNISASWNLDGSVAGYKLYWGQRSRSYSQFADIDSSGDTDYPDLSCSPDGTFMNCLVGGLKTGATYYFAYTAYYPTNAESPYSREASAIPTDSTAPNIPSGLTATAGDGEIRLDWTKNTDDTASYRLYFGVAPGVYGSVEDLGNVASAVISGLTNVTTYYFTLTAIDDYNNESLKTAEVSATPNL